MLPVDFDHMLPIEFRPTGNYGIILGIGMKTMYDGGVMAGSWPLLGP
jgi:hypothetical protein